MRLNVFAHAKLKYGIDAIASDSELSTEIQQILITGRFLDPPADGKFGPISSYALNEFQEETGCDERGFLGPETATKLILATQVGAASEVTLDLGDDLASSIVKYMLQNGYRVSIGERKYNIVYIEGMSDDLEINSDNPNEFNDLRLVLEIVEEQPKIISYWQATTEPGFYYTDRPENPLGAARIAFGQYKAWSVGIHYGSGADPHESLVQDAAVTVHRDFNRDMVRKGDRLDTGLFGINQHWGYDLPYNDISYASAGCLVGRTRRGHREFMRLIKQDKRYRLNRDYLFVSTIIPGDDLQDKFPWVVT